MRIIAPIFAYLFEDHKLTFRQMFALHNLSQAEKDIIRQFIKNSNQPLTAEQIERGIEEDYKNA